VNIIKKWKERRRQRLAEWKNKLNAMAEAKRMEKEAKTEALREEVRMAVKAVVESLEEVGFSFAQKYASDSDYSNGVLIGTHAKAEGVFRLTVYKQGGFKMEKL
jgi:aspartate aminotransferase-like enzyme